MECGVRNGTVIGSQSRPEDKLKEKENKVGKYTGKPKTIATVVYYKMPVAIVVELSRWQFRCGSGLLDFREVRGLFLP